jgi:3,4-dihydroxy 2-butanone 4-phosphate synthase/GTP cyclohydrolase II
LRRGRFVIVVDSLDESSEGDLLIAGEACSAEAVNFIVTEARGVIFLCLPPERVDELELEPMAPHADPRSWKSALTTSIEARTGVTTGISAEDRARTIHVAVDPSSGPRDLVRPGHIFPLRARPNGVVGRAGRTEAHVDLPRLAGFVPGGAISEVTTANGSAAKLPDLVEFARRHDLRIVAVGDVVRYRWRTERLVELGARVRLPTQFGEFDAISFSDPATAASHLALVRGDVSGAVDVEVFVHGECLEGHVFRSTACKCSADLARSLERLAAEERGVLVYVRVDTGPEQRDAIASQVLAALGVER